MVQKFVKKLSPFPRIPFTSVIYSIKEDFPTFDFPNNKIIYC
jgi:hypothetical protein